MSKVHQQRMFGRIDGEFVVFLIGMRINKLWKIHKWFPTVMAMPRMLKELMQNKESGFLNAHTWFGRTTIMVQYWRSFENLEVYAKAQDAEHFPAWKKFNLKVRDSEAVGVWHETYKVSEGNYESVYVNMPPFGIGKAGKRLSATEIYDTARGRMDVK